MHYQLQLQHFTFNGMRTGVYVPDVTQVQQWYYQQKNIDDTVMFPYWSKIWPAAYGMAEFLIEHSHLLLNKKVLELAAGLGLPSLIAARYAATVCCSDHAADARAVVQESVAYNALTNVEVRQLDWQQLPSKVNADIVLMSDVNYEPAMFETLYNILHRLLNDNIAVVLSTPQRLIAKPFIESIMPFVTQRQNIEINTDDITMPVTVLVLKRALQT